MCNVIGNIILQILNHHSSGPWVGFLTKNSNVLSLFLFFESERAGVEHQKKETESQGASTLPTQSPSHKP